ncbi:MAG: hypothetical protein IPI67_02200 [Myxococcales bacterium]|nr:hypothetical protein [Myxococcales bacterium]
MRLGWLAVVLLAGCSNVLGYDDVSFGDAGVSGGGGAASGGSGAGGASGTGASASGGGPVGGAAGAASGGTTASGGAASGGTTASGGAASGGTTASGGASGDPYESYRQKCFDQINTYRATLGLSPYQRWTSAEACADGEAKSDSESGKAHGAFPSCGESAQNECPGYPGLDSTVTTCLAQMWAEGPGADFQAHGHYINMSSTKYSKVACGFYQTPGGSVWAVQDFQ